MSTPYRSLNDDRPPQVIINGALSPDPNDYFSDSDSEEDPAEELPESYIHQTPWQAITGAYGFINYMISVFANFGLNLGLGFAFVGSSDVVGIWRIPSSHDGTRKAYTTQLAVDLVLASFFITFFTSWLATGGIIKAVKNGQVRPIEGENLRGGIYRFFPFHIKGVVRRSVVFGWVEQFVFVGPTLIFVAIIAAAGGFSLSGLECEMNAHSYIWFKAFWCAMQAVVVYPFILFAALNKDTLDPVVVSFFIQHQQLKLEDEQGGPPSPIVKQYATRDFGTKTSSNVAASPLTLNA